MTIKLNDSQTFMDCREQLEHALGFCLDVGTPPETTRVIAEFVLGMCKVANQNTKDNWWVGPNAFILLIAANSRINDAIYGINSDSSHLFGTHYIDQENNLPHVYHAGLRMAFADYLVREEEDNK